MKGRITTAGLVTAALVTGGCSEARKDAIKSGQTVDRSPAHVVAMPDAFRNVAAKCDGTARVYSSSTGDSGNAAQIAVVPNHPKCGGTDGR